MQETLALLQSYIFGIWRHRWSALVIAWLIAIAGWVYVSRMPESYVASARVYADTSSILGPLMRGLTITPNPNERISMMSQTLLSRPNLERLARMTDMDLTATTEAQQQAVIGQLRGAIRLSGNRGNNSLYSISVTHRDRDIARRLTQAVITVFIETSMENQTADNSGAQNFIEQQIAESEKRLVEAESRLADFKRTNVDMLPGEAGDYYNRLRRARSDLEAVRLQLRELESRQSELNRQIEGEEPVFIASGGRSRANSALDQRIQSLKVQLDQLLTRYTERHPEVRRTQSLIADLEAERQQNLEEAAGMPDRNIITLSDSPIYQGMRSRLAETRAQAAELKVRVAEYEERVHELEAQVNQIPDVEAQLTQLNRDYDVLFNQHQQFLQRRESARLSEDVQRNAGDVTFRVIDPPFVPRRPSQPNKPMLNGGVLVMALGAGGALALLLTLLFPIVTDPRMLTQTTGVPLLGNVTYKKTQAETRKELLALVAFLCCAMGLVVAYGALTTLPGLIG
jgi:polysaccharide chain length determinant protein (PEP-CTERM system associated)